MTKRKPGFCAYCDCYYDNLTKDHVLPKSRFTKPSSILLVCKKCNISKKNLTLDEWIPYLSKETNAYKYCLIFRTWNHAQFCFFQRLQLKYSKLYKKIKFLNQESPNDSFIEIVENGNKLTKMLKPSFDQLI